MKRKLWIAGTLAGIAAVVLGFVSTNINGQGVPQDAHPGGAIAVAIAALALLKASELAQP